MMSDPAYVTRRGETALFLRRWLVHPFRVGTLLPSSPGLARLVARHAVVERNQLTVEVGAGTGAVTQALLDVGLPQERLIVVEIDGALCAWLRERFPRVAVISGDAAQLRRRLPASWVGRVATVVSGLPILTLPLAEQRAIVEEWFGVMHAHGRLLQYTYYPLSPLPLRSLGLAGRRVGWAKGNVPPASVWQFTDAGAEASAA